MRVYDGAYGRRGARSHSGRTSQRNHMYLHLRLPPSATAHTWLHGTGPIRVSVTTPLLKMRTHGQ